MTTNEVAAHKIHELANQLTVIRTHLEVLENRFRSKTPCNHKEWADQIVKLLQTVDKAGDTLRVLRAETK